jgi:hypothetical protein
MSAEAIAARHSALIAVLLLKSTKYEVQKWINRSDLLRENSSEAMCEGNGKEALPSLLMTRHHSISTKMIKIIRTLAARTESL